MASFGEILRYNFIFQAFARILSFCITTYLLRHVDPSLLGIFNVRMTVLYSTIGFLTREPFRRACLSSDMPLNEIMKYAWLSPLACSIWSIICCLCWLIFTSAPPEILSSYFSIVISFTFSAFIEGLAEPLAILCIKVGENAHYAIGQSLLVFLQKLFVLLFILMFKIDSVSAFCIAQVLSSFVYLLFYIWKMFRMQFFGIWPIDFSNFDKKHLDIIRSITIHSMIKILLTEGAGFVMSFSNLLTLKQQAVYDAIERLGSLVVRMFLTPLEESAMNYFQSNLKRDGQTLQNELKHTIVTFVNLLRQVFISGLVICVFSIPYSKLVVHIFGGSLLVENQGSQLLMLYSIYLVIIAINGITECFAFSSMNNDQINEHRNFLFKCGIIHLALNLILPIFMGPFGFIIGKCIDMLLRIWYSYYHILKWLKSGTPSIYSIMPGFNLIIMLVFSFFVTMISLLIFGSTEGYIHTGAHVAVGGTMFLLVACHLYFTEQLFSKREEHYRIE